MNESVPLVILFVEDSVDDARLIQANLNNVVEFSFVLDHAKTLAEALSKLSQIAYDAIILDLGLPDSTGLGSLELIKEKVNNVPIIILSGNSDRDQLTEALNRGASNYLIKDRADGNRIAIAILVAIRNKSKELAKAKH